MAAYTTMKVPARRLFLTCLVAGSLVCAGASMAVAQQLTLTKSGQKIGSGELCPGDTIEYTVRITNNSMVKARFIEFDDPIDHNCFSAYRIIDGPLNVTDCGWQPTPSAKGLICLRPFDIDGNSSLDIVFEADLRTDADPNDICCNQGSASVGLDTITSNMDCQNLACSPPGTPNLVIRKTFSGTPWEGNTLTYTIEIENTSSDTADTNVTLTDSTPRNVEDFQLLSLSKGNSTYQGPPAGQYGNGELTVDVPTIGAGETVTLQYSIYLPVTCGTGQWGFCNQAEVLSDYINNNEGGNPRVSDNNDGDQTYPERTCTGQFPRTGFSDVTIFKSSSVLTPPLLPTGRIGYTVSFDNTNGPCGESGYWMQDGIPAGTTLDMGSIVITPPGPTDNSTPTLIDVTNINVDPFTKTDIYFEVTVDPTTACTTIANTAQYRTPTMNFTPTNTVSDYVNDPAGGGLDLVVTLDVDNLTPLPNDTVTYTVDIFNNGVCQALGGSYFDLIPAGFTLDTANVSINPPGPADNSTPAQVDVTNITVPPQGTVTIVYPVTVEVTGWTNPVCNDSTATFSSVDFGSNQICVDVQNPCNPVPIEGLYAVKAIPFDIELYWTDNSEFASYSVYADLAQSPPQDKQIIDQANGQGEPVYPEIVNVCREVQQPCLDMNGIPDAPDLFFYQVVGVCLDGTEGPN